MLFFKMDPLRAVLTRRRGVLQFKKISNLTIVFRFDRDKIEEYKRKVEKEMKKEPLLELPDTKEYLKNMRKRINNGLSTE